MPKHIAPDRVDATCSAGQLWVAVEHYRARLKDNSTLRESNALDEAERARAKAKAALKRLAAARAELDRAYEDRVAGRPALGAYQADWRRFSRGVLALAKTRARYGMDAVRLSVSSALIPLLLSLEFADPMGPDQARRVDYCVRFLRDEANLSALSSDGPGSARAKAHLLDNAALCILRPSTHALFDRSAEQAEERYKRVRVGASP